MIEYLIKKYNMNVTSMIRNGTVAVITMMGVGILFGVKNIMIAFPIALTSTVIGRQNFYVKPFSRIGRILILDLLIVFVAFLSSLNIWSGIFIDLIAIFLIIYIVSSPYDATFYKPFIMLYVFTQYAKVTIYELPNRLLSVVFGAIVIIIGTYIKRGNAKIIFGNSVNFALKSIKTQVENILENNFDYSLTKKCSKIMMDLVYKVYTTRHKGYLTTNLGTIQFKLYLDIEYMDDFRVFTWDKNKFKDPKKMIENLNDDGFKLVTIIDPGVKVDKGYKIYDEGLENNYFATDKNGIVYTNWVWPGNSVFPDFMNSEVRKWWSNNQKIMTDYGVSGIWNDMNEPASFNGPLPDDVKFNEDGKIIDHKEVHNVYGHMMDKATYEGIKNATNKRPFVVTRACYSGTQKYSTVWTGDNQSTWEHLRMSVPMLMNLGLSGMSFCGTDVGGFGYDCTPELLSRWVQVGAFTPLFRNHTTIYSRDQEPWAFDKITEDINRKYIKLRYKLIPYMYDIFYKGEQSGLPIMRPLMLHYQNDHKTYEINDQFLFGENIMVAPVLEQGKQARMIYLPKGDKWIDYWTKEVFNGGQYIVKETPLDMCPIYIKCSSIIPNFPDMNYIGEKEVDTLILDVYLDDESDIMYEHYQDDETSFEYRNGKYNLYNISIKANESLNINIDLDNDGYNKKYNSYEIVVNSLKYNKSIINNKEIYGEIKGKSVIFRCEV